MLRDDSAHYTGPMGCAVNKRKILYIATTFKRCGMECSHVSSSAKVWLPRLDNHLTIPHPYCRNCGTVKNVSGDNAKGLGYYVNALQEIKGHLKRKGGKLTQVQTRLITKELEKNEHFKDTYGTTGMTQKRVFINAVIKYTGLSPAAAEGLF